MRTSPTLGRTSGVGKEVPTKQAVNELRKTKKVTEVTVVKNPPASAGDIGDTGLIPGFRRSPGAGHGMPLQYSRLENPMDRGAWRVTVQRVRHD